MVVKSDNSIILQRNTYYVYVHSISGPKPTGHRYVCSMQIQHQNKIDGKKSGQTMISTISTANNYTIWIFPFIKTIVDDLVFDIYSVNSICCDCNVLRKKSTFTLSFASIIIIITQKERKKKI